MRLNQNYSAEKILVKEVSGLMRLRKSSNVTYPAIWRCDHISRGRYGCVCEGCESLKEMIHLPIAG